MNQEEIQLEESEDTISTEADAPRRSNRTINPTWKCQENHEMEGANKFWSTIENC